MVGLEARTSLDSVSREIFSKFVQRLTGIP